MSKSPVSIYQVQEPDNLFFDDLLRRCLKNWYWFYVALFFSVGAGYYYLIMKQPIYRINAKILIKDPQKGVEEINALKEIQPILPKKIVENEIELLYSSLLMREVVEKLNLTVHYYQQQGMTNWEVYEGLPFAIKVIKANSSLYTKPIKIHSLTSTTIYLDESEYPIGKEIKTEYGTLLVSAKQPIESINKPFTVRFLPIEKQIAGILQVLKVESAGKNSSVIQLSLEDILPTRGEAILTQLLREYRKSAVLDKNELVSNTLQFMDKRIRNLSVDVLRLEKQVESYKMAHKITDLSNQADYYLKTVQDNDAQVNEVAIQLSTLRDLENYMINHNGKSGTTPALLGLQDKALGGLVERLTQLEQQRAELEKLTADQNYLVQNLTNQIKTIRQNISNNIQTMRTMLVSSRQQLLRRNARLESQIRMIPRQERRLIDMTRQQSIKNELYTYMLKKREEMAVSFGATLPDSRVIDPPQSTIDPIKPVRSLVMAFFVMIGIACPLIVITGQKIFQKTSYLRKDIGGKTSSSGFEKLMQYPSAQSLVVASSDHTLITEQIRGLRANLQLIQKQSSQSLVLLATCSISQEGKTTISQELGISLAQANFSTVIVDMNLRNPKMHVAFNVSNNLGVSDYLKGDCKLDDILNEVPGYRKFYLISSGSASNTPTELLNGQQLEPLINTLKKRFSFVMIEAPPIGIVSDAQLLAPFADVTLFVVKHDITPKNSLKLINFLNEEKRFPQPMIVLNDATEEEIVT